MNEYDYIRLFKKNRDVQEPLDTEADTNMTDQKIPELIITPFEIKNNQKSHVTKNNSESPLSPGMTLIIKKALGILGIKLNENFSVLKASETLMKSPIWSILKKLK